MPSFIDLTGKKFSRLTVIEREKTQDKRTRWICRCECGTTKSILAYNIKHPDPARRIYSCGCYGTERRKQSLTTHGLSSGLEAQLFWGAKRRAKEKHLPFTLLITDIKIPKKCPFLGIPIIKVGKLQTANSPALDQIIPGGGYTPENAQVISNRANTMKHNASFEEFERMYVAWKAMM